MQHTAQLRDHSDSFYRSASNFIAAKSGEVNTVKILFKNTKDNGNGDFMLRDTPLIYAAVFGHVEVVRVYLEGGANIGSTNAYRTTSMH